LRANKVRVYPEDRVVMQNVRVYVGETPVFYYPLLYQSLKEDIGFSFSPGYSGKWGAFLLTQYGFPIMDDLYGILRVDLRSARGVAGGLDILYRPDIEEKPKDFLTLQTYVLSDADSGLNETGLVR